LNLYLSIEKNSVLTIRRRKTRLTSHQID